MKKITLFSMIVLLSLTIIPNFATAKTIEPISSSSNPKEVPAEVKTMLNRLEEIKKLDKSNLSSVEKKELRKEVRSIKKTLRTTGNGVYLSVGAVIIIILLLILLL
ncbi:hypothetical protein [Flavobacterium sp.]|uniref:hypothetical protein n=1 Tax=Flavobacterium sp. TaxID=239 RepID=UPI0037515E03